MAYKRTQPKSAPARPAPAKPAGPLVFTIGITRDTHQLTFAGNTNGAADLELLREALTMAQVNVQQALVAAKAETAAT